MEDSIVQIEGGPVVINPNNVADFFMNRVEKLEGAVVEAAPHVWEATTNHIAVEAGATVFFMIMGLILSAVGIFVAARAIKKGGSLDAWMPVVIVSSIGSVIVLVGMCIEGPGTLSKVFVPEYHAMHDVAKLVGIK